VSAPPPPDPPRLRRCLLARTASSNSDKLRTRGALARRPGSRSSRRLEATDSGRDLIAFGCLSLAMDVPYPEPSTCAEEHRTVQLRADSVVRAETAKVGAA
jgi:hypothetical protein